MNPGIKNCLFPSLSTSSSLNPYFRCNSPKETSFPSMKTIFPLEESIPMVPGWWMIRVEGLERLLVMIRPWKTFIVIFSFGERIRGREEKEEERRRRTEEEKRRRKRKRKEKKE